MAPARCIDVNFYPRSPRGERPTTATTQQLTVPFLSTLPARGATWKTWRKLYREAFLSTLPARGAT